MIRLNFLLLTFLAVFLFRFGTQWFLNRLNISYVRQRGFIVPKLFQDLIDQEKLKKIIAYTVDSENFGIFATLVNHGLFLVILLSGVLPWLVRSISSWEPGLIVNGLLFFAVLSIATNLLRIPFSLYETFVIEDRYGFNVMSLKMWILDLFKVMAISAILGGFSFGSCCP